MGCSFIPCSIVLHFGVGPDLFETCHSILKAVAVIGQWTHMPAIQPVLEYHVEYHGTAVYG
jgi:hypothetical protein